MQGGRTDRLWRYIHPRFVRKASFPEIRERWMQMKRRLIFSSSLQLTRYPGTHDLVRVQSVCIVHEWRSDNNKGEEFSREDRCNDPALSIIFIFKIFVKLTLSLSQNRINSSLLSKISFTMDEDNQSWGNKNSPACLWNTVYRRHRQPTTRAGHGRPFWPLQSSNPPTLSRVKRYTIHNLLQSSREKPPPVNLAA